MMRSELDKAITFLLNKIEESGEGTLEIGYGEDGEPTAELWGSGSREQCDGRSSSDHRQRGEGRVRHGT